MVVVSHLFLFFYKKISGAVVTCMSLYGPYLELSISRQPLFLFHRKLRFYEIKKLFRRWTRFTQERS